MIADESSDVFVKADSRNLPKVENVMILEYIASSNLHNVAEIRGAKMLMSSRDSYLNTAVGYVQVSRNANKCTVKAKVVPEHKVSNKLYNVSCKLEENNDIITESTCEDCVAAAGGCKHALLLLFWLAKKSSEPSPTTVSCYWNKPSLSSARTDHVTSKDLYTNIKRPRRTPKDASVLLKFHKECENRHIKDALTLTFSEQIKQNESYNIFDMLLGFIKNQNVTASDYPSFKEYIDKMITKEVIEDINKKTMAQTQSKYWHNIRQGRLSASKLYEAAHCHTDGTLVEQVLGGYKVPETKAIVCGKKLENMVLKELEIKFNLTIRKSGFILINGILGASPDGIGDDFVVEIKCPSTEKNIINYIKNNMITDRYKAQISCQMMACNKKKGIFCVADPKFETTKDIHVVWVELDEDFLINLIKKGEIFWKDYIFPKLLTSAKK